MQLNVIVLVSNFFTNFTKCLPIVLKLSTKNNNAHLLFLFGILDFGQVPQVV